MDRLRRLLFAAVAGLVLATAPPAYRPALPLREDYLRLLAELYDDPDLSSRELHDDAVARHVVRVRALMVRHGQAVPKELGDRADHYERWGR